MLSRVAKNIYWLARYVERLLLGEEKTRLAAEGTLSLQMLAEAGFLKT